MVKKRAFIQADIVGWNLDIASKITGSRTSADIHWCFWKKIFSKIPKKLRFISGKLRELAQNSHVQQFYRVPNAKGYNTHVQFLPEQGQMRTLNGTVTSALHQELETFLN